MSAATEKVTVDSSGEVHIGAMLGGKYRIDQLIAEGGMSHVYLASDSSLDERVAVKVLKAEFRQQKDVLARFVREAKTIRRIQSDHCVKVIEVALDPTFGPFMVMEYLDGHNLRDILDSGGKLVARRACELVLQVLEALAAAHTSDCIHRDIKPDNIIIMSRGELEDVRVLDFGISKHSLTGSVLNQDLSLVSTINLMGTPMYMSPEQMRSTSGADWRTDIWSIGAMLYEMLTGRPPFVSESITEVCSMVIEDEPAPLSTVEPSIPEDLSRIVHKCLQKKPADRYQNVGELALALMPFTPRRARASVERIVSTLSAAGVQVDRSEVSQYPPASGVSAPPISIPANGAVPRSLQPAASGVVDVVHPMMPPTSAVIAIGPAPRNDPFSTAPPPEEAQKRKKRGLVLIFALAGAVPFLLVLGILLFMSKRGASADPAAANASPPPPAVTALDTKPAAAAVPIAPATTVAPAAEPRVAAAADLPNAAPAKPALPAWAVAPKPGAAWPPPAATATAKPSASAVAPAQPSVAPTSKVRILDDAPSRPKVLD